MPPALCGSEPGGAGITGNVLDATLIPVLSFRLGLPPALPPLRAGIPIAIVTRGACSGALSNSLQMSIQLVIQRLLHAEPEVGWSPARAARNPCPKDKPD
jgi:hypothetical protein